MKHEIIVGSPLTFNFISFVRFGISLVAVLDTTVDEPHLQLNPGPTHTLKATDFCFYMSVTKEEYAKIQPDALKQVDNKSSRLRNMGKQTFF